MNSYEKRPFTVMIYSLRAFQLNTQKSYGQIKRYDHCKLALRRGTLPMCRHRPVGFHFECENPFFGLSKTIKKPIKGVLAGPKAFILPHLQLQILKYIVICKSNLTSIKSGISLDLFCYLFYLLNL